MKQRRKPTLDELRRLILARCLDRHRWRTATDCADKLALGHGEGWLRVALALERLANDGLAELERPGSKVRRFRRAA